MCIQSVKKQIFLEKNSLITKKETKALITQGQDGTMTSATRMALSRLLVNQHSILISPERPLYRSSNPSVCYWGYAALSLAVAYYMALWWSRGSLYIEGRLCADIFYVPVPSRGTEGVRLR